MSKKDFKGGINSLLGDQEKGSEKEQKGTKKGQKEARHTETRATFIVNEDSLEKLKAIAYWDRLRIKEVVNTALEDYLKEYEKQNGKVKPAPEK